MSKSMHSPLPWHHFEHCEGHSINDANGHHVAYTDWDCLAFDTEDAPAEHNAAFIVRACNSFRPLLRTARLAYKVCRLVERWADEADAVRQSELIAQLVDHSRSSIPKEALLLAKQITWLRRPETGKAVRP